MKKLLLILLTIPAIGLAQIPTNGLVGYWPFNSNAHDESGNGNDGIVNGATLTEDRFGNANSAFEFDGVNDYIFIQNSSSLSITSEITISAWIKRNTLDNQYREIVRKGFDFFLLVNNQNELGLGINGSLYSDGYPLSGVGEWEHVVGVYSDAENLAFLYLDGSLVYTIQTSLVLQAGSDNLRIGSTNINHQIFAGAIDDVLIYSKALSEQEVQALYTGQAPPPKTASPELCRTIYCDGENVGIGTSEPDSELTVNGIIHTKEVRVDMEGFEAPDFVFEEEYDLSTLEETFQFIQTNKHLPDMPSAAEMQKEGINLKELNLKLLQKIEELTLHLIKQEKQLKRQDEEIKLLNTRIEHLGNSDEE
jgi:hypothetical protein